jgi:hypothetical protein
MTLWALILYSCLTHSADPECKTTVYAPMTVTECEDLRRNKLTSGSVFGSMCVPFRPAKDVLK